MLAGPIPTKFETLLFAPNRIVKAFFLHFQTLKKFGNNELEGAFSDGRNYIESDARSQSSQRDYFTNFV
jgi:hypothetical protein